MNSPLLEIKQISVSFDGFLALNDLNLVLNEGDLRAVIDKEANSILLALALAKFLSDEDEATSVLPFESSTN